VYVYEFSDNSAYIGLTYNLEKRNINRKTQSYDAVTKHISETNSTPIIKQLSEYIPTNKASLLENEYIKKYKNNGWKVLNKTKGGEIGSGERIWTKELCQKEALKYNTKSEFYYFSNKAYTAAQRYGWLDEICQHMKSQIHHWTIDEVKYEALKYSARYEFTKNNKNAYIWAIRHNVLDEICQHMCSMIGTNQYKEKIK
jgi:predicted GIY-YIG superfamily endonuclease